MEREALQMCLEYIETNAHERKHVRHAIQAALAQPAQEPVARVSGTYGGRFVYEPLNPAMVLPIGMALYSAPPQPAQQEALYGMNQDDWKDVVAAISKVRDGRGIYLGCRPADVFKDWFLALGTAKVKEKNNGL
jgi:hypothetical protein